MSTSEISTWYIFELQSGPFNQIVYHYYKNHKQQIGPGSTAPSIKEMQDEYPRVADHHLPKIIMDI